MSLLRLRAITTAKSPLPVSCSRLASRTRRMSLSTVATKDAPSAIGPYSQAIRANGFVFVSGCIPLNPTSMEIVSGGIKEQATQVLKNMQAVVQASGSEINHVVKTTVFLKDMNDFAIMNEVYANFFGAHKPARSAVEVSRLPKDVLIEIECIIASTES